MDLPADETARRVACLALIGTLAWSYTDTVLDIAAQMRLGGQTKRLSRTIRQIRSDYDHMTGRSLSDADMRNVSALADLFESVCAEHFSHLNNGLNADRATAGLDADNLMLVKAVQMAMTILDAMSLFADDFNSWMRSQGVYGRSVLGSHFAKLRTLLPLYAGDRYNPQSEARYVTARILYREIKSLDIYDNIRKD